MSDSILTRRQRVLTHFQRDAIVEKRDITTTEDELNDYYENDTRASVTLAAYLDEFRQGPLTQLDKVLLTGVYTNDKDELYQAHHPPFKEPQDKNQLEDYYENFKASEA